MQRVPSGKPSPPDVQNRADEPCGGAWGTGHSKREQPTAKPKSSQNRTPWLCRLSVSRCVCVSSALSLGLSRLCEVCVGRPVTGVVNLFVLQKKLKGRYCKLLCSVVRVDATGC